MFLLAFGANYERYVILTWMHVTFYATWIRVYTFVI